MKGGKFLASGTYGCAYYPSLRCFGEDERKDLVSKIMTKHDALDELKKEEEIRKIDPNQEFSIYTVSSCIPGTIDIDIDNSLKDCHSRVISKNDFDTKNNMWKNDQYMIRDNFRVGDKISYYIKSEDSNVKGNITNIDDDGLIDIKTADDNDRFVGINPKYITHQGRKQYLLLFKKFGGPPISRDYFKSISLEILYLPLFELIKGIDILGKNNLIHQDIKCDNILYNITENKFYLIDFGLQVFKSDAFDESNSNIKTYNYFPFPIDWQLSSKIDSYKKLSKKNPDWENNLKKNINNSIRDRWEDRWGREAGILNKDYVSIRDTLLEEFKEIILDESGNLQEEYRNNSVDKLDIFSLGMVFYKVQNFAHKDTNRERQEDFIKIIEKMKSHSLKERYNTNECLEDYVAFLKKYNLLERNYSISESKKLMKSDELSENKYSLTEPLNPIEEKDEKCTVRHLINFDGSVKNIPCYPEESIRDKAINGQLSLEKNIDCEDEATQLREQQISCKYDDDGKLIKNKDDSETMDEDSKIQSSPDSQLMDDVSLDPDIIDNWVIDVEKRNSPIDVSNVFDDIIEYHGIKYKSRNIFKNPDWLNLKKKDAKLVHPHFGVYIRINSKSHRNLITEGLVLDN